jgi:hypothetical protein
MPDGIKGFGTVVKKNNTAIGKVRDVSGPEEEVDDIESTHNDISGTTKTYIPGLTEGGEVSFDVVYESSNASTVRGMIGVEDTFTLEYPDGSSWSWSGYVRVLGNEAPMNDLVTQSVTIKVADEPTFTPGS